MEMCQILQIPVTIKYKVVQGAWVAQSVNQVPDS